MEFGILFYIICLLVSRGNYEFSQPSASSTSQLLMGANTLRWLDLESSCERIAVQGLGKAQILVRTQRFDFHVLAKLLLSGQLQQLEAERSVYSGRGWRFGLCWTSMPVLSARYLQACFSLIDYSFPSWDCSVPCLPSAFPLGLLAVAFTLQLQWHRKAKENNRPVPSISRFFKIVVVCVLQTMGTKSAVATIITK